MRLEINYVDKNNYTQKYPNVSKIDSVLVGNPFYLLEKWNQTYIVSLAESWCYMILAMIYFRAFTKSHGHYNFVKLTVDSNMYEVDVNVSIVTYLKLFV